MEKSRPAFKFLRILLGLFLIAYALNKFLDIIPNSYGQMPEAAESFLDAVVSRLKKNSRKHFLIVSLKIVF